MKKERTVLDVFLEEILNDVYINSIANIEHEYHNVDNTNIDDILTQCSEFFTMMFNDIFEHFRNNLPVNEQNMDVEIKQKIYIYYNMWNASFGYILSIHTIFKNILTKIDPTKAGNILFGWQHLFIIQIIMEYLIIEDNDPIKKVYKAMVDGLIDMDKITQSIIETLSKEWLTEAKLDLRKELHKNDKEEIPDLGKETQEDIDRLLQDGDNGSNDRSGESAS